MRRFAYGERSVIHVIHDTGLFAAANASRCWLVGCVLGDLFVVVDVSGKTTGYNDLRMYFYIFFGLTSVVSLLSLLSKRAVDAPYERGGHAPSVPVPPCWICT